MLALATLVVAGLVFGAAVFQIEPDEKGVILQFGEPVRTVEPGLHFKLPFLQDVYQCKWTNHYQLRQNGIRARLADQTRVSIDATVRYKVGDCMRFFKTTHTIQVLEQRMHEIVKSSVRKAFASYPARNLFEKDYEIVADVRALMDPGAQSLGAEIVHIQLQYPQK